MSTHSYTATARREGRGWVIEVPGIGTTQTRRLGQAEAMATDMIAVVTDVPADDVEVTVKVDHEQFSPNPHTVSGREHYAQLARQDGYQLDRQAGEVAVTCPLCRARVVTPVPRGVYTTDEAALDTAVDDHLRHYCERLWGDRG